MDLLEVETYEIQESKNGLKIPIINGVHIHSPYNPEKEGNTLFNQHADALKKKSNILVLGLGYGYHLKGIINYFKSNNRSFQISVIEPNNQIVQDCLKLNQISFEGIKIYCYASINKLFESPELINFLLKRPIIVPHAPSFNLYKKYFTEYLTYKCTDNLEYIISILKDKEAKRYFQSHIEKESITRCFETSKRSKQFKENFDFALSAFGNLCETAETIDQT